MALDGIVIACMAKEMNARIVGGRISRIAQPEADALMLTIKNQKDTWKLFLSAGARFLVWPITATPMSRTCLRNASSLRSTRRPGMLSGISQVPWDVRLNL